MTLKPISFFTPIKWSTQETSLRQKMTELADAYFHLRGKVAVVIPGKQRNGSFGARLEEGQVIWWLSALKVVSFMACFTNFVILSKFPALTHKRVIPFQIVATCIPAVVFIAKVILRATSHFHHDVETKNEGGADIQKAAPEKVEPSLIPLEIQEALDPLFRGKGSVARLPRIVLRDIVPTVETMTQSMMQGVTVNTKDGQVKPWIAIKMRIVSSAQEMEEIASKMGWRDGIDFSEPIQRTLVLYPNRQNDPLAWWQHQDNRDCPPIFFEGDFTDFKNGKVYPSQSENFKRLQQVIEEGRGEDINGIRWEIIGDPIFNG
jgi:hypothetical protein